MITESNHFGWYRDAHWPVRFHIRGRWRLFPFLKLIPYIPSNGLFLDIGCGYGAWALYLAQNYPAAHIIGFDPDRQKIRVARMAAQKSGLSNIYFEESLAQDAFKQTFSLITVIDVFYLISYAEQERILSVAADSLVSGGRLLLKEMSEQPRWKYLWNWFEEWVMVRLLKITFGSSFYFRPRAEWEALLHRQGLSVRTYKMDHNFVHPHILFVGDKP